MLIVKVLSISVAFAVCSELFGRIQLNLAAIESKKIRYRIWSLVDLVFVLLIFLPMWPLLSVYKELLPEDNTWLLLIVPGFLILVYGPGMYIFTKRYEGKLTKYGFYKRIISNGQKWTIDDFILQCSENCELPKSFNALRSLLQPGEKVIVIGHPSKKALRSVLYLIFMGNIVPVFLYYFVLRYGEPIQNFHYYLMAAGLFIGILGMSLLMWSHQDSIWIISNNRILLYSKNRGGKVAREYLRSEIISILSEKIGVLGLSYVAYKLELFDGRTEELGSSCFMRETNLPAA